MRTKERERENERERERERERDDDLSFADDAIFHLRNRAQHSVLVQVGGGGGSFADSSATSAHLKKVQWLESLLKRKHPSTS